MMTVMLGRVVGKVFLYMFRPPVLVFFVSRWFCLHGLGGKEEGRLDVV